MVLKLHETASATVVLLHLVAANQVLLHVGEAPELILCPAARIAVRIHLVVRARQKATVPLALVIVTVGGPSFLLVSTIIVVTFAFARALFTITTTSTTSPLAYPIRRRRPTARRLRALGHTTKADNPYRQDDIGQDPANKDTLRLVLDLPLIFIECGGRERDGSDVRVLVGGLIALGRRVDYDWLVGTVVGSVKRSVAGRSRFTRLRSGFYWLLAVMRTREASA
jgi:hypothetical protein